MSTEAGSEVENVKDLRQRLEDAALGLGLTKRHGFRAVRTWLLLRAMGQQSVREMMCRNTWYRHVKILRAAGLSLADLPVVKPSIVVPLQRKPLIMKPVTCWADIGIDPQGNTGQVGDRDTSRPPPQDLIAGYVVELVRHPPWRYCRMASVEHDEVVLTLSERGRFGSSVHARLFECRVEASE